MRLRNSCGSESRTSSTTLTNCSRFIPLKGTLNHYRPTTNDARGPGASSAGIMNGQRKSFVESFLAAPISDVQQYYSRSINPKHRSQSHDRTCVAREGSKWSSVSILYRQISD